MPEWAAGVSFRVTTRNCLWDSVVLHAPAGVVARAGGVCCGAILSRDATNGLVVSYLQGDRNVNFTYSPDDRGNYDLVFACRRTVLDDAVCFPVSVSCIKLGQPVTFSPNWQPLGGVVPVGRLAGILRFGEVLVRWEGQTAPTQHRIFANGPSQLVYLNYVPLSQDAVDKMFEEALSKEAEKERLRIEYKTFRDMAVLERLKPSGRPDELRRLE